MSGKLFSSSGSKKKDIQTEEVVITRRQSSTLDSLPDMDACSIQSSCAISFYDPDRASHLDVTGDSCNVSTTGGGSTRPSSIASNTLHHKKSRNLLKRWSLGGALECDEQFTAVAVAAKSAATPQGPVKAVVTKHYNTVVVSSSSGGGGGGVADLSRPPSGFSTEEGFYGSSQQINGHNKHVTIKVTPGSNGWVF